MANSTERIRAELGAIRKEIRALRGEIERERETEVRAALFRRGFRSVSREENGRLILPQGEVARERFYGMLKKYSFRLFLRDVIQYRNSFSLQDLLRYCSEQTAAEYLGLLAREKLVRRVAAGRYRLADERTVSFGDTLEWLVGQILMREFHLPAAWDLRVEDNLGGGDFDVLALMEGGLLYVETKSSPPKHIHQEEISAFFDRLATLRPEVAIFLEDTELRMADKIVAMFENELKRRHGAAWRRRFPLKRLEREVFGVNERLFIINSDPDLVVNIGFCLGRYLKSRGIEIS